MSNWFCARTNSLVTATTITKEQLRISGSEIGKHSAQGQDNEEHAWSQFMLDWSNLCRMERDILRRETKRAGRERSKGVQVERVTTCPEGTCGWSHWKGPTKWLKGIAMRLSLGHKIQARKITAWYVLTRTLSSPNEIRWIMSGIERCGAITPLAVPHLWWQNICIVGLKINLNLNLGDTPMSRHIAGRSKSDIWKGSLGNPLKLWFYLHSKMDYTIIQEHSFQWGNCVAVVGQQCGNISERMNFWLSLETEWNAISLHIIVNWGNFVREI